MTSREVPRGTKPCAGGCGRERDRPWQAFCRACHAAYMRSWRRREKVRREADRAELATLRRKAG